MLSLRADWKGLHRLLDRTRGKVSMMVSRVREGLRADWKGLDLDQVPVQDRELVLSHGTKSLFYLPYGLIVAACVNHETPVLEAGSVGDSARLWEGVTFPLKVEVDQLQGNVSERSGNQPQCNAVHLHSHCCECQWQYNGNGVCVRAYMLTVLYVNSAAVLQVSVSAPGSGSQRRGWHQAGSLLSL